MKKVILILGVALFFSCSNDDSSNDDSSCNCDKLYQKKTISATGVDSGWQSVGIGSESTNIKDCSQDGKVVGSQDFSTSTQIILYRQILSCK